MDDASLEETLRKLEALHAGTTSDGEREAARLAADRVRARLARARRLEPDVVLIYTLPVPWKRHLFLRLCTRYGLVPYRRPRQRGTVHVRAPSSFQNGILWPEFVALARELSTLQ